MDLCQRLWKVSGPRSAFKLELVREILLRHKKTKKFYITNSRVCEVRNKTFSKSNLGDAKLLKTEGILSYLKEDHSIIVRNHLKDHVVMLNVEFLLGISKLFPNLGKSSSVSILEVSAIPAGSLPPLPVVTDKSPGAEDSLSQLPDDEQYLFDFGKDHKKNFLKPWEAPPAASPPSSDESSSDAMSLIKLLPSR